MQYCSGLTGRGLHLTTCAKTGAYCIAGSCLIVGLQPLPTVIASHAPHLLLKQSVMIQRTVDVHRPSTCLTVRPLTLRVRPLWGARHSTGQATSGKRDLDGRCTDARTITVVHDSLNLEEHEHSALALSRCGAARAKR